MGFMYCGFADEASKSLAGQISATKQGGWSAIELRMIDGKNVVDLNDEEWKKAYATLQSEGIKIAGFGGQIANWARPITTDFEVDKAEILNAAPHMREAGVKLLRIMSYPNAKEPWPVDQWKAEVKRRLKELAVMAEGEGIILGHENCSGYGGIGPAEYMELVEAVNSPALKLIFDTGNNTQHDQDPEATWRYYQACRDQIVHVHIKSYKPGADGTYGTCYPDEDPVQKRILADLKATGYDGWISIEPHLASVIHAGIGVTDEEKNTAIYVEYTKRLEAVVNSL